MTESIESLMQEPIKSSMKSSMMRRRSANGRACSIVLIAALGFGCAATSRPVKYDLGSESPITKDGLYRVWFTGLGAVYVKPSASFAPYDRVMIAPLTVTYKSPPNPLDSANRQRGNFELSDESMARIKQIGRDALVRRFTKSKIFTVVEEAGPGVLRVAPHIVNLVVDARPLPGGEHEYLSDAGEMTLLLDVRDSQTESPLTRTIDRRKIHLGSSSSVGLFDSTGVSIWSAVRDLFAEWSLLGAGWLENLQQLQQTPPAPPA